MDLPRLSISSRATGKCTYVLVEDFRHEAHLRAAVADLAGCGKKWAKLSSSSALEPTPGSGALAPAGAPCLLPEATSQDMARVAVEMQLAEEAQRSAQRRYEEVATPQRPTAAAREGATAHAIAAAALGLTGGSGGRADAEMQKTEAAVAVAQAQSELAQREVEELWAELQLASGFADLGLTVPLQAAGAGGLAAPTPLMATEAQQPLLSMDVEELWAELQSTMGLVDVGAPAPLPPRPRSWPRPPKVCSEEVARLVASAEQDRDLAVAAAAAPAPVAVAAAATAAADPALVAGASLLMASRSRTLREELRAARDECAGWQACAEELREVAEAGVREVHEVTSRLDAARQDREEKAADELRGLTPAALAAADAAAEARRSSEEECAAWEAVALGTMEVRELTAHLDAAREAREAQDGAAITPASTIASTAAFGVGTIATAGTGEGNLQTLLAAELRAAREQANLEVVGLREDLRSREASAASGRAALEAELREAQTATELTTGELMARLSYEEGELRRMRGAAELDALELEANAGHEQEIARGREAELLAELRAEGERCASLLDLARAREAELLAERAVALRGRDEATHLLVEPARKTQGPESSPKSFAETKAWREGGKEFCLSLGAPRSSTPPAARSLPRTPAAGLEPSVVTAVGPVPRLGRLAAHAPPEEGKEIFWSQEFGRLHTSAEWSARFPSSICSHGTTPCPAEASGSERPPRARSPSPGVSSSADATMRSPRQAVGKASKQELGQPLNSIRASSPDGLNAAPRPQRPQGPCLSAGLGLSATPTSRSMQYVVGTSSEDLDDLNLLQPALVERRSLSPDGRIASPRPQRLSSPPPGLGTWLSSIVDSARGAGGTSTEEEPQQLWSPLTPSHSQQPVTPLAAQGSITSPNWGSAACATDDSPEERGHPSGSQHQRSPRLGLREPSPSALGLGMPKMEIPQLASCTSVEENRMPERRPPHAAPATSRGHGSGRELERPIGATERGASPALSENTFDQILSPCCVSLTAAAFDFGPSPAPSETHAAKAAVNEESSWPLPHQSSDTDLGGPCPGAPPPSVGALVAGPLTAGSAARRMTSDSVEGDCAPQRRPSPAESPTSQFLGAWQELELPIGTPRSLSPAGIRRPPRSPRLLDATASAGSGLSPETPPDRRAPHEESLTGQCQRLLERSCALLRRPDPPPGAAGEMPTAATEWL